MNLFQVLVSGGWIMIPIFLSSVAIIAIGVSRSMVLRREVNSLITFVDRWKRAPAGTDTSSFKASAKMGPAISADMTSVFEGEKPSRQESLNSVENMGRQHVYNLEAGLGTLATLSAVTPLLGFLGTVTGMIKAFMQIQKLGGNVNANVLAGGIWEALVTSAAGLSVGIVALIIHNYLAGQVRTSARLIEQTGEITVKLLENSDED